MVVKVTIKGAKKVAKMTARLGPQMNKEIIKVADQFMRFIQKSAKTRAPRLTGRLAESIEIKKDKKNEIRIIVNSPYGMAQEEGFAPHFIHSDMSDRMGGTVGGSFGNFGSFFFVRKSKPFIKPALEAGIARLPEMLNAGTKKAINKSRR